MCYNFLNFNDWKIILVDVKEMDTSKISDEQTRYFIEAIQAMYKEAMKI